jgi:23S rRNA (uracil1939-C5)-methyltransferase
MAAGLGNSRKRVAPEEEASIVDLSHEGHGVARMDGKAVFVADALPGERVRLRRGRRRRSFDEATLLEVLEASPDRVEAACPHFGVCGGCALQHLSPAAQLRFKQSQLLENLARIGRLAPERVLEPLRGPVWNYRRRARLGAKYVLRKHRVVVGFRERSAPYVADLETCRVLQSPADQLLQPLAALIQGLSIANRVPQVELAVGDGLCALVLRVLDAPTAADLEQLLSFEADRGVKLYLQTGGPESIAPLREDGRSLAYELPDWQLRLEFAPTDFVQVNAELNLAMLRQAMRHLDIQSTDTVLDLFCGLGNFALPIARQARRVVGVEGETALVQKARHNAALNSVSNVEFHVANLFEDCAPLPWAREHYDLVLLDPPRAGAEQVLEVVSAAQPRRVVYVSCHPGTLARDAGRLVYGHGFKLRAAGVMDMFPHTAHVEAMAVFER